MTDKVVPSVVAEEMRTANLIIYELNSTTLSLENIAKTANRDLLLRNLRATVIKSNNDVTLMTLADAGITFAAGKTLSGVKLGNAMDADGKSLTNLDVLSGGNNSLEFADSSGNVVLNLDTGKVFAIGNLSGAGVHIYLPTTFQNGATVANLRVADGNGIGIGGGHSSANVLEFRAAAVITAGQAQIGADADSGNMLYNVPTNKAHVFKVNDVEVGAMTGNQLRGLFTELGADPTTSNLAAGFFAIFKNTVSGETRLWVNDGGTMKKSAALAA